MKKLKVAICFRGLIRTGIENRKTFSSIFDSQKWDIDYFCHTWNYDNNAEPWPESPYSNSPLGIQLRNNTNPAFSYFKLSKFKEIYNFKSFLIEDINEYTKSHAELANANNEVFPKDCYPQYISSFKVNSLKKEYEEENNFTYDLVINTRTDLVINPITVDTLIQGITNIHYSSENYVGIVNLDSSPYEGSFIDDVFRASKSKDMDILCSHFDPQLNLNSHMYLGKFAQSVGLQLKHLHTQYTILRNYLSFLDPVLDYDKILVGNLPLYHDPDSVDSVLEASKELIPLYEKACKELVQK